MGDFKRTGISNLVRRASGVYYWQCKIGGVSRRGSLETKDRKVALARLPVALHLARGAALSKERRAGRDGRLGAVLNEWNRRQQMRPDLKPKTRADYAERCRALGESVGTDSELKDLNAEELRRWWERLAARVSAQRANGILRILRHVFAYAVEERLIDRDPSVGIKRLPLTHTVRPMPSGADFAAVVLSIRSQRRRASEEAADMVEWLAYSGLRIEELRALHWEQVGSDALLVRGGEDGPKNRRHRLVPITPDLARVVARRRMEGVGGPVFYLKSPTRALTAACKRLKLPHLRVHDLRHLFATVCIESGVPVPTVSAWLGHSDGGALAMKTYHAQRSKASFAEAARVSFAR